MLWSRATTLARLTLGCREVFPSMNGLEQQSYLPHFAGRYMAEDVATEMHHAALPAGVGEELASCEEFWTRPIAGL
jgi:hypothetical protein